MPTSSELIIIDALTDRFRDTWRRGERPRIEQFLDEAVLAHGAAILHDLFCALLEAEISERRKAGESPAAPEYHGRFTAWGPEIDQAFLAQDLWELAQVLRLQLRRPDSGDWRIGPFKVETEIGRGGFGVVFLAEDTSLSRKVALKVPDPSRVQSCPSLVKRLLLLGEAQKQAAFDHPNVITIFQVQCPNVDRTLAVPEFVARVLASLREQPGLWLSMAYVEGELTLERRLKDDRPDVREAVELMVKIASAVNYLHTRKGPDGEPKPLIHRDLKPGNIMLTEAGEPKITDFGLAVYYDEQTQGEVAGTLAYMPPEQVTGQDVVPRSDVWSLGAILYKMLTGRTPFPKKPGTDRVRLRQEIASDKHLSAHEVDPRVPKALSLICDQCLEKSPYSRPTADDLVRELKQWLKDDDTQSQHAGPRRLAPRGIPKNLSSRNKMFVGRSRELMEIHARLTRPTAFGATQSLAIHAHGGRGKTTLVLEYAWQSVERGDYPGGVFVVRCDDRPIAEAIANLAAYLNLDPRDHPEDTAHEVRRLLETGPPALLILDNVDDPEQWRAGLASGFLPAGACRWLITTRCPRLARAEAYALERLPTDVGVQLLAQFRSDAAEPVNRNTVEAIVEWLDGLAVGMVLVGAFMQLNSILPWDECAKKLEEKGLGAVRAIEEDLARRGTGPDIYDKRVTAIFRDLLGSLDERARRMLQYAAFLPHQHVVGEWLIDLLSRDEGIHFDEALPGGRRAQGQSLLTDLLSLQLLRSVSGQEGTPVRRTPASLAIARDKLLTVGCSSTDPVAAAQPGSDTEIATRSWSGPNDVLKSAFASDRSHVKVFGVLPVVRHFLLEELDTDPALRSTLMFAVEGLARFRVENRLYKDCRDLSRVELDALIGLVREHIDRGRVDFAIRLTNMMRFALITWSRMQTAEELFSRVIDLAEQASLSDERELLTSLDALAMIFKRQGKLAEAQRLIEQVIAKIETKYRPVNNSQLAEEYANLAMILLAQGDSDGSARLVKRAITIVEENWLSSGDRWTLNFGYDCIASVLEENGELGQARGLFERALGIAEETDADYLLARSCLSLATILHRLGELAKAQRLMERAITIQEKYDSENPLLAEMYNMAGLILFDQKEFAQARREFERALTINLKRRPPDHPHLETCYHNLGMALAAEGERDQSHRLFEKATRIAERNYPAADKSDLARLYFTLAQFSYFDGDLGQARRLVERAVPIWEEQFLQESLSSIDVRRSQLDEILQKFGEEGWTYFRWLCDSLREHVTDDHPLVCDLAHALKKHFDEPPGAET